jgi:cyclophilin family peptidyl-prolyl cis-trans isomerase
MTPAPIRRLAGTLTAVAIAATIAACTSAGGGSGSASEPEPAPTSGTVAAVECPLTQPDPLPAGETRTVTLKTAEGDIVIGIEADLSPIAAGNFVALASCGYYDGTVFHRTATLQDGTPFVIQGGDPTGTGTGGPGYTITDEPVTTPYVRGTVAMARTSEPDSVGSQFFIVLDDKDGEILSSANTYQIIGNVTSGMEAVDAIYAASGGAELPDQPIEIGSATVATP